MSVVVGERERESVCGVLVCEREKERGEKFIKSRGVQ